MSKRPTMPTADAATAALFASLLPEDSRITIRPMFGHKAAFVNGNMFAGTFGSDVFVRLDEASRAELLAVPGSHVFSPMQGRPMKEYVQLPKTLISDQRRARAWFARGLEWTATLPAKSHATTADARRAKKKAES